jgi:hypothetical protein
MDVGLPQKHLELVLLMVGRWLGAACIHVALFENYFSHN